MTSLIAICKLFCILMFRSHSLVKIFMKWGGFSQKFDAKRQNIKPQLHIFAPLRFDTMRYICVTLCGALVWHSCVLQCDTIRCCSLTLHGVVVWHYTVLYCDTMRWCSATRFVLFGGNTAPRPILLLLPPTSWSSHWLADNPICGSIWWIFHFSPKSISVFLCICIW